MLISIRKFIQTIFKKGFCLSHVMFLIIIIHINNSTFTVYHIYLVGVGNADFRKMHKLDSDHVRLSVRGREAERDIVQFVPLHKYLSKNGAEQQVKSQSHLAKEVLADFEFFYSLLSN